MMADELPAREFEREIVGPQGAILLRRNAEHAKHCAATISRRRHPAWSRFNCGFRVQEPGA